MRNLKRLLTMVMAIAMMMSLMVVGAGAAFNDQDKIEHTDAVNMCVALGIIKGRDTGDFDPAGNVTRAEMAKMICIALNGGKEPTLGTLPTATFKDIRGHWGEKYIEFCVARGIVAGMGDGTFNPDGQVTATQAAKMLLVSLGYVAETEGFNGANWAVKINVVAGEKDLYKKLALDPHAALNRDSAAQMVWNALNATMVKYEYNLTTSDGIHLGNTKIAVEYTDKRTMLSNKYSQFDYEGTLAQFSYNSAKKEWTYTIKGASQQIGGTGATQTSYSFTTDVDFTKFYGQNVKVIYSYENNKVSKVYGMYAEDSQVLFSGVLNDITIKTDSLKFNDKVYDMDATYSNATEVYKYTYNKDITTTTGGGAVVAGTDFWYVDNASNTNDLDALNTPANRYSDVWSWSFEAIDKDGDNKVDFLLVHPYRVEDVTYVGAKSITAGTNSYTIADCTVNKDIKKGDYTQVIDKANTATNTTELRAVDKALDGKVTAFTSATKLATVDGTKYTVAAGCPQVVDVNTILKNGAVVNGFIFDADVTGTVSVDDYAVVTAAVGSVGLNGTQAKILLPDGTKKTVDTVANYSYLNGQLVKVSTNSDGDYILVAAPTPANGSGTGFSTAVAGGTITNVDGSATSGKVRYLNNWDVADDAVIFVQKPGSSFEVITGAKLKSLACSTLTLNQAFANKSTATGYTQVKMAYVTSSAALTTLDQQYGYAIANAETTSVDGKKVYSLKLWNGKEEVTVVTKDTTGVSAAGSVAKGDLVIYTLDNNGKLDSISASSVATYGAAITAVNGTYLQVNGLGQRYELTKDTKYIYIDHANKVGIEGGSLNLAGQRADGTYIANAAVVYDATSYEIDVVVFDTKNDISGANRAVFTGNPTNLELTTLLSNYSEVFVSGSYTGAGVNVAATKALSITGNYNPSTATTVSGTLEVGGNVVPTATGAINVANNATMTVYGNYTVANATSVLGALTIDGTVTNYNNITIGATGHLTLNTAAAAADYQAIAKLAGAKLTVEESSTNAAATTWYTTTGKAQTIAGGDGEIATAIGAAHIAKGTYVYGTYGFTTKSLADADITAWFAFPFVVK